MSLASIHARVMAGDSESNAGNAGEGGSRGGNRDDSIWSDRPALVAGRAGGSRGIEGSVGAGGILGTPEELDGRGMESRSGGASSPNSDLIRLFRRLLLLEVEMLSLSKRMGGGGSGGGMGGSFGLLFFFCNFVRPLAEGVDRPDSASDSLLSVLLLATRGICGNMGASPNIPPLPLFRADDSPSLVCGRASPHGVREGRAALRLLTLVCPVV